MYLCRRLITHNASAVECSNYNLFLPYISIEFSGAVSLCCHGKQHKQIVSNTVLRDRMPELKCRPHRDDLQKKRFLKSDQISKLGHGEGQGRIIDIRLFLLTGISDLFVGVILALVRLTTHILPTDTKHICSSFLYTLHYYTSNILSVEFPPHEVPFTQFLTYFLIE